VKFFTISFQGSSGSEAIDSSNPHDPESDEYLKEHARRCALTIYHLLFVDYNLKVKGISKLRVVDASIMPDIVSGNTNACVIMIAEC
jgi:choline dehydrogenase